MEANIAFSQPPQHGLAGVTKVRASGYTAPGTCRSGSVVFVDDVSGIVTNGSTGVLFLACKDCWDDQKVVQASRAPMETSHNQPARPKTLDGLPAW